MDSYGWLGFDYMIDCFKNGDLLDLKVLRMQELNPTKWKKIAKQVFSRDGYKCQYCGIIGVELEVDHKIPFSRGGSNELANLTTACITCNRKKHDKTPEEFLKWRDEHE